MEEGIIYTMMLISGILLLIGGIFYALHLNDKMKIDNFQVTINELNNEQKCLHICGFQYSSSYYFDQYKFCVEKCDRISERQQKCAN